MGKQKKSSFDQIKTHLIARGAHNPVPARMRDDMEALVRRCDEVRSLGQEYGSVELSPYMASLLRVTPAVQNCSPVMSTVASM